MILSFTAPLLRPLCLFLQEKVDFELYCTSTAPTEPLLQGNISFSTLLHPYCAHCAYLCGKKLILASTAPLLRLLCLIHQENVDFDFYCAMKREKIYFGLKLNPTAPTMCFSSTVPTAPLCLLCLLRLLCVLVNALVLYKYNFQTPWY